MTDQICGDEDPRYTHAVIDLMARTRPSRAHVLQEEARISPEAFNRLAGEVLREPIESMNEGEESLRRAKLDYEAMR